MCQAACGTNVISECQFCATAATQLLPSSDPQITTGTSNRSLLEPVGRWPSLLVICFYDFCLHRFLQSVSWRAKLEPRLLIPVLTTTKRLIDDGGVTGQARQVSPSCQRKSTKGAAIIFIKGQPKFFNKTGADMILMIEG
jgi:hypothetical protein